MSNGLQPHVQRVSAAQAEAARGLVLTAAQARDAGDIAFHVDNAMDAPDSDAMVVMLGRTVIGFYRLDSPTVTPTRTTVDPGTVTLRAFALDRAWQAAPSVRRRCTPVSRISCDAAPTAACWC